ncbi:MAG: 2-phospho-L-lactate guanylyltransferase [Pseudomonadota bacterium]|nr:2-phospho-L-lactate guanylyltransferase [Pseudomonadota bacterium]
MSFWAITPIKSFKRPKSRLGDVLTLEDRRVLVKFMLGRILLSQRKSKLFTNYLIATEDSNVIDYVKKLGFKAFLQKKPGLNNGITEASKRAIKGGAKGILIIHGDIPRTSSSILQSVAKKHKKLIKTYKQGITISPDSEGEGTNCMVCTPPDIIKFKYGPGSCLAHLETAHRAGIQVRLYRSKKLEFDIDRDADLSKLIKKSGYTNVKEYINSIKNE